MLAPPAPTVIGNDATDAFKTVPAFPPAGVGLQ